MSAVFRADLCNSMNAQSLPLTAFCYKSREQSIRIKLKLNYFLLSRKFDVCALSVMVTRLHYVLHTSLTQSTNSMQRNVLISHKLLLVDCFQTFPNQNLTIFKFTVLEYLPIPNHIL